MAYDLNPGQGSAFKHNKQSDKSPDYVGTIKTPDGNTWDISMWITESAKGTKYFSIKTKEPYKKDNATRISHQVGISEDNSDLPF